MRAAIYARYSSENQRPESIDDQVSSCKKLAATRGFMVDESLIFPDEATSGARSDRKGLAALLAASEAKKFYVVLVDDLSRLARDNYLMLSLMAELHFNGVRVISVADGLDTGFASSPEMLRCERVAGSDFKITLEPDRPIIIYETDRYDDFPWHVSRRMGGSSGVVIRQALFQIACKAHIALVGVGYALKKVDILHGHHPLLKRMMSQYAKVVPYFARAPCKNLWSLELRRVILRSHWRSHP